VSNEVFDIKRVTVDVPAYALRVQRNYMEPRARMKDGRLFASPCSGQEYYQLAGDGISIIGGG